MLTRLCMWGQKCPTPSLEMALKLFHIDFIFYTNYFSKRVSLIFCAENFSFFMVKLLILYAFTLTAISGKDYAA